MLDLLAHGSHKTECYLQILIKNTICQNTLLFLLSSSNTISYCFIIYIYFYFHCITSIHNDGTPRNVFPLCLWAQDGFRRAIRTRRELQGLRGFITPLSLLFPLRSLSFRPITPAHPFPVWVLCFFQRFRAVYSICLPAILYWKPFQPPKWRRSFLDRPQRPFPWSHVCCHYFWLHWDQLSLSAGWIVFLLLTPRSCVCTAAFWLVNHRRGGRFKAQALC